MHVVVSATCLPSPQDPLNSEPVDAQNSGRQLVGPARQVAVAWSAQKEIAPLRRHVRELPRNVERNSRLNAGRVFGVCPGARFKPESCCFRQWLHVVDANSSQRVSLCENSARVPSMAAGRSWKMRLFARASVHSALGLGASWWTVVGLHEHWRKLSAVSSAFLAKSRGPVLHVVGEAPRPHEQVGACSRATTGTPCSHGLRTSVGF